MKTDIFGGYERLGRLQNTFPTCPTANVRYGKSSSSTRRLPIQRNNWKNSAIMCSV